MIQLANWARVVDDAAAAKYQQERIEHWNRNALLQDGWTSLSGRHYHRRITQAYQTLVPPGRRVLELGCAQGDLLAALRPAVGVGVDFSEEMIRRATERHPELRFIEADAHDVPLDETFDFIILSDLVNDLWDLQAVLRQAARLSSPRTRLIINTYSRVWQPVLGLARRLRLAVPELPQNWFVLEDLINLLNLGDFEVVRKWTEVVLPAPIPLVSSFCNRYLARLWPFKHLAMSNFLVARPLARELEPTPEPVVSVIVPARNEAGNMTHILDRIPEMGGGTEVVFVEGHSRDDTYAAIERTIAAHPERRCQLLRQTGVGKGDAVRLGFEKARGEVLMILDADLTMPPEDLPRFYDALRSGKGEFINGVRLVYPMEGQAMRFFNLLGNKFFSAAFSWLLGQSIKDTLCGTKVLWKTDYDLIAANRSHFGDFDPFGDFDLLFGAAHLNLKLADLPIRYRDRTYGATNIHRWRHGWLLLQMVAFAARRIKFI